MRPLVSCFVFFLQGILSFKLIDKLTNDKNFVYIIFHLLSFFPIFIYRLTWHPALFAHWIFFITIFFLILYDGKNNNRSWIILLLIASLIKHFIYAIINLIIYNFIKFNHLVRKKISFNKYLSEIFISHISLILLMCI